jgi:hypothetical protein
MNSLAGKAGVVITGNELDSGSSQPNLKYYFRGKMARKKKFYAVKVGRKPGICIEWFGRNSAETQVKDYPIAIFIGFPRLKKTMKLCM